MSRFESIGPLGKKSYIKLEQLSSWEGGGEKLIYKRVTPEKFDEKDIIDFVFVGVFGIVFMIVAFFAMLPLNLFLNKYMGRFTDVLLVLELIFSGVVYFRNLALPIISYGSSWESSSTFNDENGQKILASIALNKSGDKRYLTLREERILNRYAKNKNDVKRESEASKANKLFNDFVMKNYGEDLKKSQLSLERISEAANNDMVKLKGRLNGIESSSQVVNGDQNDSPEYKLNSSERSLTYSYIAAKLENLRPSNYSDYQGPFHTVLNNFNELTEREKYNYIETLMLLKSNMEAYYRLASMMGIDDYVVDESLGGLNVLIDVMIKPVRSMANRIAGAKRDSILIDSHYASDKYGLL